MKRYFEEPEMEVTPIVTEEITAGGVTGSEGDQIE